MYSIKGSFQMHSNSQEKTALINLLVSIQRSGVRLTEMDVYGRTLGFEVSGSEEETRIFKAVFDAL